MPFRGLVFAFALIALPASAAEFPAPKPSEWIVRDFKFHTGEVLPELRLAYTTVGEPTGEPVVVLHGTTGSAPSMLTANFGGELYGAGQPLDASKYYIIIPDSIGHGRSSKPSDGLRTKFPQYTYDDMVEAQYRLLTEHLKIGHVRLVIGNSMGGMHTWLWGAKYPDYMDALVPMASQPTEMSSRNWMMRRLLIETVRSDPEYNNGNYTAQPRILKIANLFYATGTNGGNLALQKAAPTRAQADRLFETRLAAPMAVDANDYVYAWNSSRDYNAAPGLDRIKAALLAINAADDERNPPETGLLERELKRVKNGRLLLIPASEATSGHGTTASAKFYAKELNELLQTTPKRAM
ncbi:MAG: homoserine O-acetyltransferase/O-succinyltransferase [Hyphomicrobiales bacterium]|jgi:homoserine O-acetyltransferase|nr:homoserine O-acetyltransferase/O-succinyltransferase [Hyphomicrobiales bacterium]